MAPQFFRNHTSTCVSLNCTDVGHLILGIHGILEPYHVASFMDCLKPMLQCIIPLHSGPYCLHSIRGRSTCSNVVLQCSQQGTDHRKKESKLQNLVLRIGGSLAQKKLTLQRSAHHDPSYLNQRIYFWFHTLCRFFGNGFFTVDKFFLKLAQPLQDCAVHSNSTLLRRHFLWLMSASWFLVSTYLILNLGPMLILSNNQSIATLWVLDTCLIVGLLALTIILMTASLSSEM